MAKFSACYQLCPLIDQKDFLGVSDESVNGCVIITLGKNMVIRYKLSDQKQVSSWSSRNKLSAPVVYDASTFQYIGVFNANQISTWKENDVQLNNLKKDKLATSVECILTSPISSTPVVVFRNGYILPLQKALSRRKEVFSNECFFTNDETISDAHLISVVGVVTVAMFTTTSKEVNRLYLIPLEEGLLSKTCLLLQRKGEEKTKLIGHTLMTNDSCKLLTLWSDGQLFSLDIPIHDSEKIPGRLLTTLTKINTSYQAAILPLSSTHLAIYGADASEEGAVLFIFNTQLCVIQCNQYFKLYTPPARLWAGGRNSLLVAAGQYVTVVPFYLGKQRLAALVGSQDSDASAVTKAGWGSSAEHHIKDEAVDKHSFTQKTIINSYLEEGMSHRMVCQSLFVPSLDCSDINELSNLLEIVSDIPETCIVSILALCLKGLCLETKTEGGLGCGRDDQGIADGEEVVETKKKSRSARNKLSSPVHQEIEESENRLDPVECKKLLHTVLRLPVTPDLNTLKLLRDKMSVASILILLNELCEAMLDSPADPQLVEWAILLLDAHYQQYLLSRDETVEKALTGLRAVVDKQLEDSIVWQQLEPLLLQLQDKQGVPDPTHLTNTSYSIDQITLY